MTSQLELTVASGADLTVRRFTAEEAISEPFSVSVWARIPDPALYLGAIVGQPASLSIDVGQGGQRTWTGIVSFAELAQVESYLNKSGPNALSTYYLRIVPTLWLLTQRRNHRIYQHSSILEIVDHLLGEWQVEHRWEVDEQAYPPLEYKVQWGESDYTFFSRLLEEGGISYVFEDDGLGLVLTDAPEEAETRDGSPTPFAEGTVRASHYAEYVTHVELGHEVRPGAFTFRDYDFRRPAYPLFGEAERAPAPEQAYEQYHYAPGVTVIDVDLGEAGPSPVADDRGWVRHVNDHGFLRAERALEGERAGRRRVQFEANFVSISAGDVFTMSGHPHDELGSDDELLVTALEISCDAKEAPRTVGRCAFAAEPWTPRLATPKPKIRGVHAALVVGPPGDEIAPDEFGRVRVQFPWDREGKSDEFSSCWMHVSAPWGGLGYGYLNLPRIGQEVLVDFLDGDPDRPIVVGRVFDATQPVPYRLPENKTKSTWKTDSSLGSNGFNEIMYEDKAGDELVSIQAEKNHRKLVKNDETITVVHDREKHVIVEETDSTGNDRTEVTRKDRTQRTHGNRIAVIQGAKREHLVKQERTVETDEVHVRLMESDLDAVVVGARRERLDEEVHLHVLGDRRQRIDGEQSLSVGEDRHETVGRDALVTAGESIHVTAGWSQVWEGGDSATLKGSGGFLQIDAGGVTIVGKMVRINAGGSPGGAQPSRPDKPADAKGAVVAPPALPPPPAPPDLQKGDDHGVAEGRPHEHEEKPEVAERQCEILKLQVKATYVNKADAYYDKNPDKNADAAHKIIPSNYSVKLETDRRKRNDAIPQDVQKKLGKRVVELLSRYDLVIEELAGFPCKANEELAKAPEAGHARAAGAVAAETKSPANVAEVEVEAEYEGHCPHDKHARILMKPADAPPNLVEYEPPPVNGKELMLVKEVEWDRGKTQIAVKEIVAATFNADIGGGDNAFSALIRLVMWVWNYNKTYDLAFTAEACGIHSATEAGVRDLNAVVRIYRDISIAFGVKVPPVKKISEAHERDTNISSGKTETFSKADEEKADRFELYFKLNEIEFKLKEYKPGELRDKAKEQAETTKKAYENAREKLKDWSDERAKQKAIEKALKAAFDDLLPFKDRLELFFDDFVNKVRGIVTSITSVLDLMRKAPQLGFKLTFEIGFLSGDFSASGSHAPADGTKAMKWPLPDRYAPILRKAHLEFKATLITFKVEASFGFLVDAGAIGKIEARVAGSVNAEISLRLMVDVIFGQTGNNLITVPLTGTSTANLRATIEVKVAVFSYKKEIGIESGIVAEGRIEVKVPELTAKYTLVIRSLETGWYIYSTDLKTGRANVSLHKIFDGRPLVGPLVYP